MKIINQRHIPIVAALLLAAASLSAMTTVSGLSGSWSRGASDSTSHDSTAKEETPIPESSVIDEVVWVVGDEPILKSDVEMMRMQGQQEGMTWGGNPDCAIPEQLAVQKLFLHQAEIDSIEVSESEIAAGVQQQLNRWIEIAGSQEKLEEYRKESINEIRNDMHDEFKNQQLIQKMKQKLVEDVKVSPADVRSYFRKVPQDSLPYVPTEVEVQVIQVSPKIKQSEINRVKDELRGFTERVNNGETSFSTLARLYSEDPGSARQGGELGFMGRGRCRRSWSRNSAITSFSSSTSVATRSMCATSCSDLRCRRTRSMQQSTASTPSAPTFWPTSLPLRPVPPISLMTRTPKTTRGSCPTALPTA